MAKVVQVDGGEREANSGAMVIGSGLWEGRTGR